MVAGFTSAYKIHRPVYFESFADARDAIAREKQIKGWWREKKVALIEKNNPTWEDLASEWLPASSQQQQVPRPDKAGTRDDSAVS